MVADPVVSSPEALPAFTGICSTPSHILGLISMPLWKLILITLTFNNVISEGDVGEIKKAEERSKLFVSTLGTRGVFYQWHMGREG